jgi:uncharacterized protein
VTLDEILQNSARQATVTDVTQHRPWPLPDGPWLMAQSWVDLAFLHWRVDAETLRRQLPESVELDTFDGSAWLGIVPFRIADLRLRGLLPVPGLSSFPELNVRTFVMRDATPGLWFFTLDASSILAVEAAKRFFHLPYRRARMSCERVGEFVHYESARADASFSGRYHADGAFFNAEPGTLEEFLVERYCFYTENGGRLYRCEIHHPPWELQRGEAFIDLNTMALLPLPDEEPHVLISRRQDAVIWTPEEL